MSNALKNDLISGKNTKVQLSDGHGVVFKTSTVESEAAMQSQKIVNNDNHKIADQQSQTKDIWFPMI